MASAAPASKRRIFVRKYGYGATPTSCACAASLSSSMVPAAVSFIFTTHYAADEHAAMGGGGDTDAIIPSGQDGMSGRAPEDGVSGRAMMSMRQDDIYHHFFDDDCSLDGRVAFTMGHGPPPALNKHKSSPAMPTNEVTAEMACASRDAGHAFSAERRAGGSKCR